MRQRTTLLAVAAVAVMGMASCRSHHALQGVTRTRILIDDRYDAHPDAAAMAFLKPYEQKVDSVMRPVVGEVAEYMWAERPESNLSNLLADIMVWAGRAYGERPDVGVYNMGGIRAALAKGPVTYGDVVDVAPFENKICFMTLTGDKLLELFRQMAAVGGEGVSHGVRLVITRDGHLVSASLDGKEIDASAQYRVATLDYLAQGNDRLMAFRSGTDVVAPQEEKNNTRYIIRDYFLWMKQQGKVVDSKVEGRITIEE